MRILYISHVRWGWIKQRPHFLAEGLAKNNQVDYYYYQSRTHCKKDDFTSDIIPNSLHLTLKPFSLLPFKRIPIIGKWSFFDRINWLVMRWQLPSFMNYDVIWITHPSIYPQIKRAIRKNNKLVYDCMDDMIAFPEVKNQHNKVKFILTAEKQLLKKASLVFSSSDYLRKTILKRARIERDIVVVNNAVQLPDNKAITSIESLDVQRKLEELSKLTNVFMYIGTISEWFDFEKMLRLVKDIPTLNIVLIGPKYAASIPNHPRFHLFGPIERQYIFTFMEKAKALIMPFVVNELIESVNPVKLYEYIYSGKPSLASYYSETDSFKEFVYLYNSYDELKEYSIGIVEGKLLPQSERNITRFIKANTWEERIKQIERGLN